jgi:hypothetical protein
MSVPRGDRLKPSKRRALVKLSGAGTRITLCGTNSDRQIGETSAAASSGSQAKTKPPSFGDGYGFSAGCIDNPSKILVVLGIAPQELPCQSGAVELPQIFVVARRSPVRSPWHTLPPRSKNLLDERGRFIRGRAAAEVPGGRTRDAPTAAETLTADVTAVPQVSSGADAADVDGRLPSSSGRAPDDCHGPGGHAQAHARDQDRR